MMTEEQAINNFLGVTPPPIVLEPLTKRQSELYPMFLEAAEIVDDEVQARRWVSKTYGIAPNKIYGPYMEIKDKGYDLGFTK